MIEKTHKNELELTKEQENLSKAFLFCCAYSSSIGGLGSLGR
jgi:hypothetical protein